MKIIVIDDEPIMVKSFVRLSKGISNLEIIGTFEYAVEAEAFARTHKVDMAVLDIHMPEVDGIELARRLKTIWQDILIVFISADESPIMDVNGITGDYYISKPYNKSALEKMAQKMETLFQRQG